MSKILIVDDELNNRLLLEEILEDFEANGTQLLYASDGQEALEIIRSQKPELVFLDIMLPDMNGLELCRLLKSELEYKDLFIAVLTAKTQASDKKRAQEVQADMYISKPFRKKVIIDLVKQLFGTAAER